MTDDASRNRDPALATRSTAQVLEDHLRCRQAGDLDRDLSRNYAGDVVLMSPRGVRQGHGAVRDYSRMLRAHVPARYEFPVKLTRGPYAFIEWRAREPGRSVEDGADSFVIRDGRIVFQTIHYTLQETMPA